MCMCVCVYGVPIWENPLQWIYVYNVHALACCLLCSRRCVVLSGCAIADMINALFRLLLSVLHCWLVGCVFILHSDDRIVFRLFIRLLRFILAQAKNALRLCIVRMLSTIQCFTTRTLTLTHAHSNVATYACTITHISTQMAKCPAPVSVSVLVR